MGPVSVMKVSSATNAQECVAWGAVSKASRKEVTKFSAQHSFRGLQNPLINHKKGERHKHLSQKARECLSCTKENAYFK